MEFDWKDTPFDLEDSLLSTTDIEESFEDPFAVKLLPDGSGFSTRARYFNLGKSSAGKSVISYYTTNGKTIRVIHARRFVEEENYFYLKQLNETLLA
jgi:uncharacterized DUF497 family protein